MTVRSGFCSICRRQVNLSDGESFACPVCSSPLIESTAARDRPGEADIFPNSSDEIVLE